MCPSEVSVIRDSIEISDFQQILKKAKPTEPLLIDFSHAKKMRADLGECQVILEKILCSCKNAILIGPAFLQDLVDLFPKRNLVFILKTSFKGPSEYPIEKVELLRLLCLDYFKNSFPDLQLSPVATAPRLLLCSSVKIDLGADCYRFNMAMTEEFFHQAVEKFLLIPIEGDISGYADLIAEVLNMYCAHLRSGIVPDIFQMKVGIPIYLRPTADLSASESTPFWSLLSENQQLAFSLSKQI